MTSERIKKKSQGTVYAAIRPGTEMIIVRDLPRLSIRTREIAATHALLEPGMPSRLPKPGRFAKL